MGLPRWNTRAGIKTYLESLTAREVEMMSQDAYNEVPRSALSAAEALVYGAAAWFLGYQTPDAELIGDIQMDDENGGGEYLPVGGYDVIRTWARTRKPATTSAAKPAKKPATATAAKPAKKPASAAAVKSDAPKVFGLGDVIVFGAPTGEHTRARIVRVNERTYTVETLESRGREGQAGAIWRVGKRNAFAEGDPRISDSRRTVRRRSRWSYEDPPP